MKAKQNTAIFIIVMIVLIACFFGAGYLNNISPLSSVIIGVFVLFSIILYYLLNHKKQNLIHSKK